jgi:hypothetical protein
MYITEFCSKKEPIQSLDTCFVEEEKQETEWKIHLSMVTQLAGHLVGSPDSSLGIWVGRYSFLKKYLSL